MLIVPAFVISMLFSVVVVLATSVIFVDPGPIDSVPPLIVYVVREMSSVPDEMLIRPVVLLTVPAFVYSFSVPPPVVSMTPLLMIGLVVFVSVTIDDVPWRNVPLLVSAKGKKDTLLAPLATMPVESIVSVPVATWLPPARIAVPPVISEVVFAKALLDELAAPAMPPTQLPATVMVPLVPASHV